MQVAPAPDSARSNFSISAVKIRYNVFWRSEKTLQCLSSFVSLCAYYTGKFCIEASLNYSDSRIYAYYSFVTLSVQGASQILACRRPAAIKSGNDPEQLWCSGDIVLIIIIWLWSLYHLDSHFCEWHRLMSFWHSFKCSSIHSFTSIRFLNDRWLWLSSSGWGLRNQGRCWECRAKGEKYSYFAVTGFTRRKQSRFNQ